MAWPLLVCRALGSGSRKATQPAQLTFPYARKDTELTAPFSTFVSLVGVTSRGYQGARSRVTYSLEPVEDSMISRIACFVRTRVPQKHEGEEMVDYSLIVASALLVIMLGLVASNPQIRAMLFVVKPG